MKLRLDLGIALAALAVAAPAARPEAPSTHDLEATSVVASRLAADLVPAAAGFVARARDIVQSAARTHGEAALADAVARAWPEHFAVAAVEGELEREVRARLSAADARKLAAWDESDVARRLSAGRRVAPEPPSASLDPARLEGDDRVRYELARRLVEACDVFAGSYGAARQIVVAASLVSLRLLGIPEERIAARSAEIERMFDAELAAGRSAMQEAVLASTFHGGRELAIEDLIAEIELWRSDAGRARCEIQTAALAAALVSRLESFPAAVTAAATRHP